MSLSRPGGPTSGAIGPRGFAERVPSASGTLTHEPPDAVGARTPGGRHLRGVARRQADERPGHRRLGRELPGGEVGLGGADDGPRRHTPRGLVEHLGGTAEGDDPGARLRLDDRRAAQPLTQPQDPRLQVRLVVLGDVVVRVLLEVTELACRVDARAAIASRPAPSSSAISASSARRPAGVIASTSPPVLIGGPPLASQPVSMGDGGIRVCPWTSGRRNAISSSKHQLQSSPGSSERMIACPDSLPWAEA
jgi:hypothetical protein